MPGRPGLVTAQSGTGTVRTPQPERPIPRRSRSGPGRSRAASHRCRVVARAGHRSGNPGNARARPGIWSMFQTAAEDGGIAGLVPAQACPRPSRDLDVDAVTRARRPRGQLGPHRRAVLPQSLAEPADADPATHSSAHRASCPSGPVGQAGQIGAWGSAGSAADTRSCMMTERYGHLASTRPPGCRGRAVAGPHARRGPRSG